MNNYAVFDGFPADGADPLDYFKHLNQSSSVQQETKCPQINKTKMNPLEKILKDSLTSPYNTKKYAFNNSVNMRTLEAEL